MSPSGPNCHSSVPLMWTGRPEPPGPVFLPTKVQWYAMRPPSITRSSKSTCMSGNALMNERAASVIAGRPTDGAPPLIVSDPSGA